MKNYSEAYSKLQKEHESYVKKIKELIFNLLELNGASQIDGGGVPGIYQTLDPKIGYEFSCNTYGTGFNFNVRVEKNYVEATGIIIGARPAKFLTKRWYNLKRLEMEFINVFGQCFYKKQSFQEIVDNKPPIPIRQ